MTPYPTHTVRPVSYTHLDVYKRQILYNVIGNKEVVFIEIFHFEKNDFKYNLRTWKSCMVLPVSYTHLDVYKRQALLVLYLCLCIKCSIININTN